MRLRASLAVLALALTGALTAAGGTASAAEPDPMAGAPAVGSCFDVTIKQGMGDRLNEAPVPCSADHTLLTSAVVEVPAGVDITDAGDVDDAVECASARERLVGKDPRQRALTLYYDFMFLPTADQVAAGARWASCHVAVWDAKGLNDLPQTLPKLKKKPADAVARCLSAGRKTVTCAEKHAYRATVAVFVKASGSDKAVERAMKTKGPRTCLPRTGRTGLYGWYRYTDTKVLVTCYTRTTR